MTKFLSAILALLSLVTGLFSSLNFTVNYYVYQDVYYGTDERQCLDITIPGDYKGDLGLVLYIHGGSWIHGSKDGFLSHIKRTTKDYGYAAASINYRYVDSETDCFDILDDIDAALAEIKEICAKKGINIKDVVLHGNSAGAHLALMYAYARRYTAPITPAAVISLCAPTNLTKDSLYYNSALATPRLMAGLISKVCGYQFTLSTKDHAKTLEALLQASPINYIDENTVPTLIVHGMLDEAVDFSHAVQLNEMLSAYGVEHDFIIHPKSGHYLDKDPEQKLQRLAMTYEYLDKYLCKSAYSDSDSEPELDFDSFPDSAHGDETDTSTTVPSEPTTDAPSEILPSMPDTEESTEVTDEAVTDEGITEESPEDLPSDLPMF